MPSVPFANALFTVDAVQRLDRIAIDQLGVEGFELMSRAARAALECLRRHWPDARRVLVLCGPGNNGGDGYLLATFAHAAGLDVRVAALDGEPRDDAARARESWRTTGRDIATIDAGYIVPPVDVIVDALFGIGLRRALDGAAANLVALIERSGSAVLALDVPSGLSADTGAVLGNAVRADVTISFVAWKRGLFTHQAPHYCGRRELATLALPFERQAPEREDARLLDWNALAGLLPRRSRDAHKGVFGNVLCVGGDDGMAGAIRMAGEAALRTGAGLCSIATRGSHVDAVLAGRPELMVRAVEGAQELDALLARASVVALGPGLGTRAWGHALWHAALSAGKPVVLDADGVNLLARQPYALPAGSVLTPHPAEAARLLETDTATVQADRYAAVRSLARRCGATVVLKGAGTLIADSAGPVAVCPWGNPGMASGGMGDVLTGVIAGLIAQGVPAFDAACLGVAVHARAADAAAARDGERGLLASDLLVPIRRLLNGIDDDIG